MNNFESFDNSETATKKDIVIQERVDLVSSHMYKQFLDYQHSTVNTNDIFAKMVECLELVADNLKQSFNSRGVTTQNIYVETDALKSVAVLNILWHKMSFTTRCNFLPQALYRADKRHILSNRIIALPPEIMELVKKFKSERDIYIKEMGTQWNDTERLFTAADGRPMHVNTPYTWLKKLCEKNNFPFYGIHTFRHYVE